MTAKTTGVKDRLLEAAVELLQDHGPSGATARAICGVVGVKQPALYHHYGQLDALHQAAVDEIFKRVSAYYAPTAKTGSPEQSIRQSWDAFIHFAKQNPLLYAFVNEQIIAGQLPTSVFVAFQQLVEDLTLLEKTKPLTITAMQAAQLLWAGASGAATLVAASSLRKEVDTSVSEMLFDALLAFLLAE